VSCLSEIYLALQSDVSPEIFARKLLGRTDIEDGLKRLDILIQEEVQMAIAQILKVTSEVKDQIKDGTLPSTCRQHHTH
jgi:hypothetical protein